MKISLAQLNFHVGNFEYNTQKIKLAIKKAREDNADLVLFSELALTGYPPHDLLEHKEFMDKCYGMMDIIAAECTGITAVIGAPTLNRGKSGKKLCNSALVLSDGQIRHVVNKALLPTYDIFDEYRYFEPSDRFRLVEINGKKVAITICEDLWDEQQFDNEFSAGRMYQVSPMEELSKLKPDLILNLSASPFSARRTKMKEEVFRNKAARHKLPLFMCNQVGANTELVFEGGSMVIAPDGSVFDTLNRFKEDFRTYSLEDIKQDKPAKEDKEDIYLESIFAALVLGVSDFFSKSGFKTAILGLSGGIDSAVTLAIAAEALGADKVKALALPSMYSSSHSVDDAVKLAHNLGVNIEIINIAEIYNSTVKSLENIFMNKEEDVTEENIQARIRALLLMAVSNKFGDILLNTSNKSEAAVGYGTLYGDMAGGLSVIGDVYKTDVYRLAGYINRDKEIIPVNTITKPPSAELKPGQQDSDSLPEYDILDSLLYQYIELQRPAGEIKGNGITPELVNNITRLINLNEYKRFQTPPILRISSKAFGYGRRMPLVAKY